MQKWIKDIKWNLDHLTRKHKSNLRLQLARRQKAKIPQQLYNKILSLECLSFFFVNFSEVLEVCARAVRRLILLSGKIKYPINPLLFDKGIPSPSCGLCPALAATHWGPVLTTDTHIQPGVSGRQTGVTQSLNVSVLSVSYVEKLDS